jgi:hypothetical protein
MDKNTFSTAFISAMMAGFVLIAAASALSVAQIFWAAIPMYLLGVVAFVWAATLAMKKSKN